MKKTIFAIIAVILVSLAGWYYYNFNKYAPTTYTKYTPSGQVAVDTTTGATSTTTPTYTLADISTHNNATSCFSAVSGSVYDLTAWVNMHPGGKEAILSMCGHDGTEAFMNEHHGRSKFINILARYKIGTLK